MLAPRPANKTSEQRGQTRRGRACSSRDESSARLRSMPQSKCDCGHRIGRHFKLVLLSTAGHLLYCARPVLQSNSSFATQCHAHLSDFDRSLSTGLWRSSFGAIVFARRLVTCCSHKAPRHQLVLFGPGKDRPCGTFTCVALRASNLVGDSKGSVLNTAVGHKGVLNELVKSEAWHEQIPHI